jgi:hypothetical protein
MPDPWDEIEIGWLLAYLAEANTLRARELRHRRRVFNKEVRRWNI